MKINRVLNLRKRYSLIAAGFAAIAVAVVAQVAKPVDAAPPNVSLDISINRDGTANFDANNAAGNDSGPNNGIVRVNDTVEYAVEYAINNNPAENVAYTIKFPKGIQVNGIPAYCGTGSSLVPAAPGSPSLPLQATANNELAEQTLVCNLGNKAANTAERLTINTTALGYVPNGHVYQVQSAAMSLTHDGGTSMTVNDTTLPQVTASSRLKWDISKNGTTLSENSNPMESSSGACSFDSSRVCMITRYSVMISSPDGVKGSMPAIGNVTFTDDFSPASMYPGLSAAAIASINADLNKYGTRATWINGSYRDMPYPQIGSGTGSSSTSDNSVRNSGTTTTSQPSPGAPAVFTASNVDWSLLTTPTKTITGAALPSNVGYAYAGQILAETPVDTIKDFGTQAASVWTLPTTNRFTSFNVQGFSPGDTQTINDQPGPQSTTNPGTHWNDYRTTTPTVRLTGNYVKRFVGVPGAPGNISPTVFNPGYPVYEGLPGGASLGSGSITVAANQTVISQLTVNGSGPVLPGDVSAVACDAWDNTKAHLAVGNYPGSTVASTQYVPSGGDAVWISGYNNVTTAGTSTRMARLKSEVPALTVQYSAVPGGTGTNARCDDATKGPWYNTPQEVPGNDPALAATGVYTAVSRIRAHVVMPAPAKNQLAEANSEVSVRISIPLKIAENVGPNGTIIPNWATVKRIDFQNASMSEVLASTAPGTGWTTSFYNADNHTGDPGDRLILVEAQVRVNKTVRAGTSGPFSKIPPSVTGGDTVQYQLAPSLTSGAQSPGILKDVWVEECLPSAVSFTSAAPAPTLVSSSTPADAQRAACAAGETYVRWVIPNQEVNAPMDPIIVTTTVRSTAPNGTYPSSAIVSSDADVSNVSFRRDEASISVTNIARIALEQEALTPIVQANRPGQTANEQLKWSLLLANVETSGTSNPDMINILPKQGQDGTNYHGTLAFISATVTGGGSAVRILYSSTASINEDPQDPTNAASGSTTWCDAATGGTPVYGTGTCPASPSEVTGLRIIRPGAFDRNEHISIELAMEGVGNQAGDVYVNRNYARVNGVVFGIGPVLRSEEVIASDVGDYVFWDKNKNGIQDGADSPAAGVVINLAGIDDLGNIVKVSTVSEADGSYHFDNLRASDASGYVVHFELPEDALAYTLQFSPDADIETDSDANTATGLAIVHLGVNASDQTIDAGFIAKDPDVVTPPVDPPVTTPGDSPEVPNTGVAIMNVSIISGIVALAVVIIGVTAHLSYKRSRK